MMRREDNEQTFWELIVATTKGKHKYMSFTTKEEAEKYCDDNGLKKLGITKVKLCEVTSFGFNVIERETYYGKLGRRFSYIKLLPDGEAFYDRKTGWHHYSDDWSELSRIYYQIFGSKIISPLPSESKLIFSKLGVSDDCYDIRYKPYIYSDQAIEYISRNSKEEIIIVEHYPKYGKYNKVLRIFEYGSHDNGILIRKSGTTWISLQNGYSLGQYNEYLSAIGWIGAELPDEFYRAFTGKTPCLSVENGIISENFFPDTLFSPPKPKRRGRVRAGLSTKYPPMFK